MSTALLSSFAAARTFTTTCTTIDPSNVADLRRIAGTAMSFLSRVI